MQAHRVNKPITTKRLQKISANKANIRDAFGPMPIKL